MNAVTQVEPSAAQAFDQTVLATTSDLRSFVHRLQRPRVADAAWMQNARERCAELSERFAQLKGRTGDAGEGRLQEVREALARFSTELAGRPSVQRLRQMSTALSHHYEDLVAYMGEQAAMARAADELRPIRLIMPWRTLMHVGLGVVSFVMYQFLVDKGTALAILGVFFAVFASLEISRRFSTRWNDILIDKVFALIARPRERYQTNSASYYLLGLTIATWLTPQPAVLAAVLILAFADPMASLFGSRWGKRKLYHDKSVVGSLSFLVTGLLVAFAYLALFGGVSVPASLGIAAVMALAGTAAELFGGRIDDNLSIPLVCAFTGALFL